MAKNPKDHRIPRSIGCISTIGVILILLVIVKIIDRFGDGAIIPCCLILAGILVYSIYIDKRKNKKKQENYEIQHQNELRKQTLFLAEQNIRSEINRQKWTKVQLENPLQFFTQKISKIDFDLYLKAEKVKTEISDIKQREIINQDIKAFKKESAYFIAEFKGQLETILREMDNEQSEIDKMLSEAEKLRQQIESELDGAICENKLNAYQNLIVQEIPKASMRRQLFETEYNSIIHNLLCKYSNLNAIIEKALSDEAEQRNRYDAYWRDKLYELECKKIKPEKLIVKNENLGVMVQGCSANCSDCPREKQGLPCILENNNIGP